MVKNNSVLYVIIGILLIALVIAISFDSGNDVQNLDSKEFSGLISSEKVFLINVHTPYEGEIEGTDLIAEDWENMENYINKLPEDKNMPVAIYCRSGRMSSSAAEQLRELGYTNIYNLEGGMNSWENSGKEIIIR
jgi:rhodanese-related sulfurtransferase